MTDYIRVGKHIEDSYALKSTDFELDGITLQLLSTSPNFYLYLDGGNANSDDDFFWSIDYGGATL